jgi:hypothetical protein
MVTANGINHGAWHRASRCLMQNVVHAGARGLDGSVIGDVGVAEIEPGSNASEIFLPAMRKIIDAANFVALLNQSMCNIGTNKAGNAGDQVFRHATSIAF